MNFHASENPIECGYHTSYVITKQGLLGFGSNEYHQISSKDDFITHTPEIIDVPVDESSTQGNLKKKNSFRLSRNSSVNDVGSNKGPNIQKHGSFRLTKNKSLKNLFGLIKTSTSDDNNIGMSTSLSKILKTNVRFSKNTNSLINSKFQMKKDKKVIRVSSKGNFTVFLCNDGSVYTCGINDEYNLGVNDTKRHKKWQKLNFKGKRIKSVVAGGNFAFFISEEKLIFGCGRNEEFGQLGFGDGKDKPVPTILKLKYVNDLKRISCGWRHTLFLYENGTVYACGKNFRGCLGVGDEERRLTPTLIPFTKPIEKIFVGYNHNICIDTSGQLWSFGNNSRYQLCLAHKLNRSSPEKIPFKILNGSHVNHISMGFTHTIFLMKNHKLYGVGKNLKGQICVGFSCVCDISIPVEIIIPIRIKGTYPIKIASGNSHNLFYMNNGDIYAAGLNSHSQIGIIKKEEQDDHESLPKYVKNAIFKEGVSRNINNENENETLLNHFVKKKNFISRQT